MSISGSLVLAAVVYAVVSVAYALFPWKERKYGYIGAAGAGITAAALSLIFTYPFLESKVLATWFGGIELIIIATIVIVAITKVRTLGTKIILLILVLAIAAYEVWASSYFPSVVAVSILNSSS